MQIENNFNDAVSKKIRNSINLLFRLRFPKTGENVLNHKI